MFDVYDVLFRCSALGYWSIHHQLITQHNVSLLSVSTSIRYYYTAVHWWGKACLPLEMRVANSWSSTQRNYWEVSGLHQMANYWGRLYAFSEKWTDDFDSWRWQSDDVGSLVIVEHWRLVLCGGTVSSGLLGWWNDIAGTRRPAKGRFPHSTKHCHQFWWARLLKSRSVQH